MNSLPCPLESSESQRCPGRARETQSRGSLGQLIPHVGLPLTPGGEVHHRKCREKGVKHPQVWGSHTLPTSCLIRNSLTCEVPFLYLENGINTSRYLFVVTNENETNQLYNSLGWYIISILLLLLSVIRSYNQIVRCTSLQSLPLSLCY